MKEQDAAHSFKKEFFEIQFVERAHKLRENLNLVDAMRHLYNEFVAPVEAELTRLRSELQQKNEEITRLKSALVPSEKYIDGICRKYGNND